MRSTKPWMRNFLFLATVGLSATFTGCIVAVDENPDKEEEAIRNSKKKDLPEGINSLVELCSDEELKLARYEEEKDRLCFRDDKYKWRTSCKSESCQEVNVYVHYMLNEDLGNSRTVAVEAFDNPNFHGSPVSTVQISNFNASRAGSYDETTIYLEPGEYYLRSFVAKEDEQLTPYSYEDMELVGGRPVGVMGALSSPEVLRVEPRDQERWADPVHLSLDKLFKKPGEGPGTGAFLRISFEIAATETIPESTDVIVQLHDDVDLNRRPQASFKMPTEKLLITGHVGKAEFLTPELELGTFIVFAFVDTNGNGFYDAGELAQISALLGEPRAIQVQADRTAPLSLVLIRDPKLP
jgi:hypothetical protein